MSGSSGGCRGLWLWLKHQLRMARGAISGGALMCHVGEVRWCLGPRCRLAGLGSWGWYDVVVVRCGVGWYDWRVTVLVRPQECWARSRSHWMCSRKLQ